ncbi:hypothetical protein EBZ39_00110 [bacterium]|nr:hypothetical protein [bacterium]
MPTKKKTKPKSKTIKSRIPTPQAFLKAAGGKLLSVEKYCWHAYGKHAFFYDIEIPVPLGSAQMIVNTEKFEICEMTAVDNSEPEKNQAFRWANPSYKAAHHKECRRRGFDNEVYAWDKVKWVNVPPQRVIERMRKLLKKSQQPKK